MKKIILAIQIAFVSALLVPAYAGSNFISGHKKMNKRDTDKALHQRNENWVNYQTAQQFSLDFPNAKNVSWYEGDFAEATFQNGSIIQTAYYDNDNSLIGTTQIVPNSTLSQKTLKEIQKDYPGYAVNKVILFKDNENNDTDMIMYSTPFDNQNSYFAEIGNGAKNIVLQIGLRGNISYFHEL